MLNALKTAAEVTLALVLWVAVMVSTGEPVVSTLALFAAMGVVQHRRGERAFAVAQADARRRMAARGVIVSE